MQSPQPDDSCLYRFVRGTCSEEERRAVEAWMAQDPARRAEMAEMRQLWELAEGSIPERDVEAAWQQFRKQIATTESLQGTESVQDPTSAAQADRLARPRRRTSVFYAGRVAAVLLLAAGGLFLVSQLDLLPRTSGPDAVPEERVYCTPQGQRAVITLTDGTVARLNVGSKMVVPGDFDVSERAVRLDGEAFFEVTRDDSLPFVVRTEQAAVQVLGTAFNVHAYREQPMHVAVAEGRVALRPDRGEPDDTLTLRPHEIAFVADEALQGVERGADLSRYLGWTEGRLVFRDAPFEEVVALLERWYDLDIETSVPYRAVGTFNGAFKDEPLREILDTVVATLGLKYRRDKRRITFYRS